MTIIFAAFGRYAGFEHAVRAARTRGKAPVVVLSDQPDYISGSGNICSLCYPVPPFHELENSTEYRWLAVAEIRWLAINAYVKACGITGPLMCPDWDIVLFSPVEEATAHLRSFPACPSKEVDSCWSAAWLINDPRALSDYCDWLHAAVNQCLMGTRMDQYNDMATWSRFLADSGTPFGNLADITPVGTFDHNIHCGVGKYRFNGPAKEITWIDGNPHFTLLDGTLVRAHNIHCWGTYKNREAELCQKAGI